MKILFFFLLYLPLFSDTYPLFSKTELNKINKKNPISHNRIMDYKKYLNSCQSYPQNIQLNKINFYLNNLLPQYDSIIDNRIDYWATPKEFLTIGYGDCEDYAIIKYYSLIKLGFDEKKLFITVVKESYSGGSHMVLCYFKTKSQPPLVLDNLSFKVLNLQQRTDLTAQLFINSTGVYQMKPNYTLKKIAAKLKQFEELKEKIKNNL